MHSHKNGRPLNDIKKERTEEKRKEEIKNAKNNI